MNKLDEARKQINEADAQIAALFEKRMAAVREVAEYKKQRGLPVYDAQREAAVISKNGALINDDGIKPYYVDMLTHMMKVSRDYQRKLISGVSVAYSGVEGAFAYIAADRLFPNGIKYAYKSFDEAYDAVVRGDCECAVIPIENSFAGEVGAAVDLIFRGSLYINDVLALTVKQNLIGQPGATEADIKTVVSHPQALSQCAEYISSHGYEVKEYSNTALAVKYVAELNDKTVAAIGTAEAAALYGASVITPGINSSANNTTRFAVLSRKENDGKDNSDNSFFLVFSVKNQAGALAEAINIIGKYGYNMSSLHSRPMRGLPWQYYFYMEGEGNIRSDGGASMLSELSKICDRLRLVGSYKGGQL